MLMSSVEKTSDDIKADTANGSSERNLKLKLLLLSLNAMYYSSGGSTAGSTCRWHCRNSRTRNFYGKPLVAAAAAAETTRDAEAA